MLEGLISFRLNPLGSDNDLTGRIILRVGVFSLLFCSYKALRLTLVVSAADEATVAGLGVDLSHFSRRNREFFGVADVFVALGDSPNSIGVERLPSEILDLTSGLSRLDADVQEPRR